MSLFFVLIQSPYNNKCLKIWDRSVEKNKRWKCTYGEEGRGRFERMEHKAPVQLLSSLFQKFYTTAGVWMSGILRPTTNVIIILWMIILVLDSARQTRPYRVILCVRGGLSKSNLLNHNTPRSLTKLPLPRDISRAVWMNTISLENSKRVWMK